MSDATTVPPHESAPKFERGPLVPRIRILRVLWRMLGPLAVAANLVVWSRLLGASASLQEQAVVAAIYGYTGAMAVMGVFGFVAAVVFSVAYLAIGIEPEEEDDPSAQGTQLRSTAC